MAAEKAEKAEKATDSEKLSFGTIALVIAAACIAGLVVLPRLAQSSHRIANPMVGTEAPTFALPVVANSEPGARIDLKSLRGHPVLLDFWASWCGPCAAQAPIVDRIRARYATKGLTVVGIDVDEEPIDVAHYAKAHGVSYPMVYDGDGALQRAYGVTKLPSLIVIDKDGKVASYTGPVDEGSLDSIVRDTL